MVQGEVEQAQTLLFLLLDGDVGGARRVDEAAHVAQQPVKQQGAEKRKSDPHRQRPDVDGGGIVEEPYDQAVEQQHARHADGGESQGKARRDEIGPEKVASEKRIEGHAGLLVG